MSGLSAGSYFLYTRAHSTVSNTYNVSTGVTLNIDQVVAAPVANPVTGSYLAPLSITLSTGTIDAQIYYRLDGGTPSTSSTHYTGQFTVNTTSQLRAIAVKPNWLSSAIGAADYTLTLPAPAFSRPSGSYAPGTTVAISSPIPIGPTITYTTNGADPTASDPVMPSGGALAIGTFTLKAKTWMAGATPSAITSATYTLAADAIPSIAGGGRSAAGLRADGTAWGWGANNFGAVGDGTTSIRPNPVSIGSGVAAVSIGNEHGLALLSTGAVRGWGHNNSGQVGDGTTTDRWTPVTVTGVTDAVAIDAGNSHSVAVRATGQVVTWGYNAFGQLGDGTTTSHSSPAVVTGLTTVTAIAAGGSHTLALKSNGTLTRADTSPNGRVIADAAIGELLRLEARLGHEERLQALLTSLGDRPVDGAATERVTNARETLAVMRTAPAEAFRCGPYALVQMIEAFRPGTLRKSSLLMKRTGPQGSSLAQLKEWASAAGIETVAIEHAIGDFPVPAVVHLKSGHFAALLRRDGARYLLNDPALGGEVWISSLALGEEASGAMLVPADLVPASDRALSGEQAASVWGRGNAANTDEGSPQRTDDETPSGPCGGMLYYAIFLMSVSLHLFDTPLGYAPPVGPAVQLRIDYNQRESHQPGTFTYTNLGPKWTIDWLSYVVDNPSDPTASVQVFLSGGGQDQFTNFDSATGLFAPETRKHTTLRKVTSSPIRYERTLPDGSVDVFTQSDGSVGVVRRVFMTQRIDPQGNALTFTYDSLVRLVSVMDAIGQVTTLSYDLPSDQWKVTKVTDPFLRSAVLTYDAFGRLKTTTDTIGLTSSVTYNSSPFQYASSLTTPYGTTRFLVGVDNTSTPDRSIEVIDPLGARERVELRRNDFNRPPSESPLPTATGVTFNNGNLEYRNSLYWNKRALAVAPDDPTALPPTNAHIYHWLHRKGDVSTMVSVLESEKRPLENRVWYAYPNQNLSPPTVFEGDGRDPSVIARVLDDGTTQASYAEYNALGRPTKLTDPLGRQTTLTYAANSLDLTQVKQTTGGINDVLMTATYNAHHQPLTITDAANKTTTLTYNARGQLLTASNPLGQTTTLVYDSYGYLQSVTGPVSGATHALTYDSYGRFKTVTTPDGYITAHTYDPADRLTSTTFPDGTVESFVYDRLDLVRVKDRAGRWSTASYDSLQRVVAFSDSLGRVVRQNWCTCGSLDSLTDPNGNKTTWDRDVLGRVTKETRANASLTTYSYENTTSRLKSLTDPKLQVKTYSYANDNALLSIAYTNATTATAPVSFTYDPVYPRLTRMTDGSGGTGFTDYTYVPVGTLGAGQRATVNGPLSNDIVSYTYDELGRVSTRTLGGVADTWTYDALGRLQTESDPIGTFTFAYEGVTGRLQQLTYPNGQTSSYSYFGNTGDRRLQEIHHRTGAGATLSRFSYDYDRVGNITTWTQQYGTDVKAYDFSYDAADQLIGAVYRTTGASPTILKRYGYAYDPAGNRTTARTDDTPLLFAYNIMNRLTSQSGGGVVAFSGTANEPASVTVAGKLAAGAGTSTFAGSAVLSSGTSTVAIAATDASGNMSTKSYEVDVPTSTGTFSYDANGNLIVQGTRSYEWDAENRLVRVLDGGTELARFVYDGAGRRVQKTTSVTRLYVYDGLDILQERVGTSTTRTVHGPGIDQPLASVDGNGVVSYYLADHLRSIVQQTNAAGAVTLTRQYDPNGAPLQGGGTSGYAFTGRDWDSATALYYYRARHYDPQIGRFISEDPIGFVGGDVNLFGYVSENPTSFVDPLGLHVEVLTFSPVGIGKSSFGHAAISINGTTYSFTEKGRWFTEKTADFLKRNGFRDAV